VPGPDAAFWQQRFESGDTPWDRGAPSPQLLRWLDEASLRPCRIAVPGCGSGWDAVELARRGFSVTAVDLVPAACDRTRARAHAAGVSLEVVQSDMLAWRPPEPFDAVFEQTCLCAIHPFHWSGYAGSMRAWIRSDGALWALFMQRPRASAIDEGRVEGPPYHCDISAMQLLFPAADWAWPEPPLVKVPHPAGWHELGACLRRRA
jgi:SAM-dependent methyltransferase